MNVPQPGIFQPEATLHQVMEWRVPANRDNGAVRAAVLTVAEDLRDRDTSNQVRSVIAFSAALLDRIGFGDDRPEALTAFSEISGATGLRAPATQRDILIWLHGEHRDALFDAALAAQAGFVGIGELELELPGFQYHDSRDLTGFIDGSANPEGDAARIAALVRDGQAGAAGSIVLTQKWVHDLPAFNALTITDQERVIGRTKPDSIELEGDAMPADSHVSRTDAKVDGVAQKIYRRSFPYGTIDEHGLYFLAFSTELSRFEVLLARMYGISGDGLTDHLLAFSKPVTGSYWFAPPADLLIG